MDCWLRQSTAVTVPIGPFVDSTDGDTEETALTIAQADVRLTKNGAASAQKNNASSASHDADGMYLCPLSTTDTNTLGQLVLWVHVSGALFAKHTFHVVPANIWDSFFSTDLLDVSVVQFNGTNGTFSGGRPEVNASHWGGTAVASAYVRATLEQILGSAVSESAAGRIVAAFNTFFNVASSTLTTAGINQTGDNFTRIGAPVGASISADIASVKTDTGNLVTRITSTLFSGITSLAQWLGAIAGKQTANSTARTEIRATGSGSGTFDETTDSVEAIRDNMGTAQTGDAYARIGANGAGLSNLPWNASWDAEVQSEVADALDAAIPGTPTANSINERIQTMDNAYTAARAGNLDNLDASVNSRLATAGYTAPLDAVGTRTALGMSTNNLDTQLSAINSKTTNLPADPADASDVAAAIAALNNISTSDVLTQVNAALNTAISELGVAAPSATPTLRTAVMLLYMALRNRTTTTATAQTIQNDAGTTIATAALSDDGTTMTKAEFA